MGNKFRVYNSTFERDTDSKIQNLLYYPYITMVNKDNIVGSTQFVKYYNNGANLYDILVKNGDNFLLRKSISDIDSTDDSVVGICVIPQNVLHDGCPRFITLFDIDDKCYGGYTESGIDYLKKVDDWIERNNIPYNGTPVNAALANGAGVVYDELFLKTGDGAILTTATTQSNRNIVPLVNKKNTTNLNRVVQRVAQYTGAMPSDVIHSGKKASYYDSGLDNYSYYYNVGGDVCDYVPSVWKLNGDLNPAAITQFYYDKDLKGYVSFANALLDYYGYSNTLSIRSLMSKYDTYVDNNDNTNSFRFRTTSVFFYLGNTSFGNCEQYIPAIGELSFIIGRTAAINSIIDDLNDLFDLNQIKYYNTITGSQSSVKASKIDLTKIYISSSEASYDGVYCVFPVNGSIINVYKDNLCTGRPFIKLDID